MNLLIVTEIEYTPGGGHGNPLQYSCLENLMDRGAWRAKVQSHKESDIIEATQQAGRQLGSIPPCCVQKASPRKLNTV